MRKFSLLVLAIFFIFVFSAKIIAHENVHTDPSSEIKASVGQDFTIRLKSNATTGFKWELDGALDEKIVKFINSDYDAPKLKMVGVGGYEYWRFKAVGPGRTKIPMKYVRSWEKSGKTLDVDKVIFSVIVR